MVLFKVHLTTKSSNRPGKPKSVLSKYAEAKLSPTHSCSPGAYLVVDGVAARYANVYQTIADWAIHIERGIVRVDSHKSAPPSGKSLPFACYSDVWLLFITQDNINSRLNKRGCETDRLKHFNLFWLCFFSTNPAPRHPFSALTLPLCLAPSGSAHIELTSFLHLDK